MEILSRYIARVIARGAEGDPEAMGRALQSVISPAIRREIAENEDHMIDVLYPILGGMIAKYVTNVIRELLEKINRKIEDRFSLRRVRRKIKAKLTGVSETELMLEESFQARILSIFVIHKETGLLVAESSWGDTEIDDPHMVASMASALKDFINDWIRQTREVSEVQLVSYGTSSLYIESAGSVYLIAFLDREPDFEQRERINAFFARLVEKYREFFQGFDGDDSAAEIPKIIEEINTFIREENRTLALSGSPALEKEKSFPWGKAVLVLLVGALAGSAAYYGWRHYQLFALEKRIAAATGVRLHLEEGGKEPVVSGVLRGLEEYDRVRAYLDQELNGSYVDRMRVPLSVLEKARQQVAGRLQGPLRRLERAEAKIEVLESSLEAQRQSAKRRERKLEELSRDLEELSRRLADKDQALRLEQKRLERVKRLAKIREEILNRLQKVFEKDPQYHPQDGSYDFRNRRLFEAGSAEPGPEALKAIRLVFEKYIKALLEDPKIRPFVGQIVIWGNADSSGDREKNLRLSADRAARVRKYLASLPSSKRTGADRLLVARGLGAADPVRAEGREDAEASRRIKIGFRLDERALLRSLEERMR